MAIGGISCKMEEYKGEKSMYIMTIGVLPNYRRYRIGTSANAFASESAIGAINQ